MANSVNPDQTAPIGPVCSGSTLFASILLFVSNARQLFVADDISNAFFLGALRVNRGCQPRRFFGTYLICVKSVLQMSILTYPAVQEVLILSGSLSISKHCVCEQRRPEPSLQTKSHMKAQYNVRTRIVFMSETKSLPFNPDIKIYVCLFVCLI